MKNLSLNFLCLSLIFCSTSSFSASISNMPATFLDAEIPNTHLVSENVIRGMAPRNVLDLQKLLDLGVQKFLMFKIDTNGDIAKEMAQLQTLGVSDKNMLHLEFPWQNITDFNSVCEMTVEALNVIKASDLKAEKIYFHCTVGEDRTGYLAGLYKIYSQSGETREEVFENEMCDKGYEAGNPKKIYSVVKKIRDGLTPAFLGMADLIEKSAGKKLTKSSCKNLVIPKVNYEKFSCKKSKLL
ncbi:MAG: hypothetical protein K2Q18_19800 [Bdellovibrionales bacterium]|nr:hypothetical protein [Bdellovibrionales bacterium]